MWVYPDGTYKNLVEESKYMIAICRLLMTLNH